MLFKRVVAVACLCLLPGLGWAQSISRIAGVVRDETGAPVRGVIVRAEIGAPNTAPLSLTAATDDRGRFIFVVARSGEWRLTFDAPGFETMALAAPVRLGSTPPTLDIKLERREAPELTGAMAGVDARQLSTQLASAAALLDQGKYEQAIAAYREIKGRAPALTLVSLQIGNAYFAQGAYAEAEAAYQETLKANAEEPNGLFAMGRLREAQGNAADARAWYQKAAAADDSWTKPLMRLAELARAGGDGAAASAYLQQVVTIDPESPDAAQAKALLTGAAPAPRQ